ncbi:hypothetical protein ACX3PU_03295 [Chryseobacterium sp. A301]
MTYKTKISRCWMKRFLALFAMLLLLFSPCPMKASVKMWVVEASALQSTFSKNLSVAPSPSLEICTQNTLLSFEKSSKVSADFARMLPAGDAISIWTKAFSVPDESSAHSKYVSSSGFRNRVPLFLKYQKLLLAFG